jgi:hypothetical protein
MYRKPIDVLKDLIASIFGMEGEGKQEASMKHAA